MLAVRFHDKKEIYLLSTLRSMAEVGSGKSDKEGRSVKMLPLITDYTNIWEVLIKMMQWSEIIVVSVSHTNGQQKCFSILLRKWCLSHLFHIRNMVVKAFPTVQTEFNSVYFTGSSHRC